MENESTFVAPEGVYSVTDEHKTAQATISAVSGGQILHPTRVSTVLVKFPAPKPGGGQAFAHLLGGGSKDTKKPSKDDASLSSSDTEDIEQPPSQEHHTAGNGTTATATAAQEQHTIFSNANSAHGKKKATVRPKHNIRTTSSTFIARIQTAEGLSKTLASKQGDVTFLFYNLAKTFNWVEAGSKAKVYLAPECSSIPR
jgi:catabolite repression protein CreC